jgi:hypothetical protein
MNKILRFTEEQAIAFVECWKADARWGRVAYLFPDKNWFPYVIRVRVMLGQSNKLASNACWDGLFNRAKKILMVQGLAISREGGKFSNELAKTNNRIKKIDDRKIADFRKQ